MKKICLLIVSFAFVLSSCNSDKEPVKLSPLNTTWENTQNVNLPGNYDSKGVDVTLPSKEILYALGITESEFLEGLGTTVSVGYTLEKQFPLSADAVVWSNGRPNMWFDKNGKVVAEGDANAAIYCGQKDNWVWNTKVVESLCGKGDTYYATQAFKVTGDDGGTRAVFVRWGLKSVQLYPLAEGTTTFDPSTGIASSVKMLKKEAGKEYKIFGLELPDTVYRAIAAMSPYGYDNLAYFIASGQIKAYAYPKQSSTGSQLLADNEWSAFFDKDGAEVAADAEGAAIGETLILEDGSPLVGGGKYVALALDQKDEKVLADKKKGDEIKIGVMLVYGTSTYIPWNVTITIVDKLDE